MQTLGLTLLPVPGSNRSNPECMLQHTKALGTGKLEVSWGSDFLWIKGHIFFFEIGFFFMCICICLHVCQYTMHVPGVHRGQKKSSNLLELVLCVVVNHSGPFKSNTCFNYWDIFSVPPRWLLNWSTSTSTWLDTGSGVGCPPGPSSTFYSLILGYGPRPAI